MSNKNLYQVRDTKELGKFYEKHIEAMERENLVGKTFIAAELATRDKRIAELEQAMVNT